MSQFCISLPPKLRKFNAEILIRHKVSSSFSALVASSLSDLTDVPPLKMGRICFQISMEAHLDNETRQLAGVNPFDEETAEHVKWQDGWTMAELDQGFEVVT